MTKSVWTDGCYDLVHYGHANLLRQARLMGERLVVGVHSDQEIAIHKGHPVMCMAERVAVLESIRWVDDIVPNVPFVTLPNILDQYACRFCVHGNDEVLCGDGSDPYSLVKACDRFKTCPRTACVSSTDVIERVLSPINVTVSLDPSKQAYLCELLKKFQQDCRPPTSSDSVVYIAGNFELLHPLLITYFAEIKKESGFLLVGVLSDEELFQNYNVRPAFTATERALAMLSCRYVDWVVIDPPLRLTPSFLASYHINRICHGDCDYKRSICLNIWADVPKSLISNNAPPQELSVQFLWERVRNNQNCLMAKVAQKRQRDPNSIR